MAPLLVVRSRFSPLPQVYHTSGRTTDRAPRPSVVYGVGICHRAEGCGPAPRRRKWWRSRRFQASPEDGFSGSDHLRDTTAQARDGQGQSTREIVDLHYGARPRYHGAPERTFRGEPRLEA